MKVLVTGSSSYFAQALVPRLCAEPGIAAVTGIDARRARFADPKFSPVELAFRQEAVLPMLAHFDALVHLACVALPGRMSATELFDVNVRASHKLFHAARAAGVKRLVHMSSATVYGEAIHASEQASLKPLPGFLYAEHQAQLEQLLAIELPECVRLRPQLIVGPHAHPALKGLLKQPFYARLSEPHPLLQCVHEDDLASAVLLALSSGARGAYNIAIEDSFSLRDVIRARHAIRAGLPLLVARAALKAAGRVAGWRVDPGVFQALSHTLLVNCRRAIIELGWRSHYSAEAALAAT